MARFVSPITDMKPLGHLLFYKSGTNTVLVTYKDELETIANVIEVPVNADGNLANVFFSSSAKVKFFDQFSVQYAERDPVGGEKQLGDFTPWDTIVSYDKNDITEGSDGKFYISLSNGNEGNDPTTSETDWKEWPLITRWNTNVTYVISEVVQSSSGNLWKALTATTGSDPETDDGTNWLPAFDNNKLVNSVIPRTVSGTLTSGGRTNEIRDSGAFTMPLANSVAANVILVVDLPGTFNAQTPTLTRSGPDLFRNNLGTDTVITWVGAAKLTLTSDGVSEWSL